VGSLPFSRFWGMKTRTAGGIVRCFFRLTTAAAASARLHIFGRDHHIQSPTGYTPSNQSTGGALRRALSDPLVVHDSEGGVFGTPGSCFVHAPHPQGWWQRCRFVSRTFFEHWSCQLEGKKIRDLEKMSVRKSPSQARPNLSDGQIMRRRTNYEETDFFCSLWNPTTVGVCGFLSQCA